MKLTKKLEAEILKAYCEVLDANLRGDMRTFASILDENCHIFGTAASEVFKNKKAAVKFYTATAGQITGKVELRNRNISVMAIDNDVMVNEQADFYILIDDQWTFYNPCRVSCLFHKKNNKWKVIHQHGSFPDSKTEEGEQVNTDKIKAENVQLRDAVKRRTIELEEKNRELEIEAAIERVRAKALAMHRSEDIHEVVRTLRNELFGLNLEGVTAVTICLKQDDGRVRLWDITDVENTGRYTWDVTFNMNEIDPRLWVRQIWSSKKKIIAFEQDSNDLKRTLKWLSQYDKKTADEITALIKVNKIKRGWHRAVKLANGRLITDFINEPPAEIEIILLKMGAAFDLAYKRFLDLKNAEEQTREAQIEAALERVRSRTNAMHRSENLHDVINEVNDQLRQLGFRFDGTDFLTDFSDKGYNIWLANFPTPIYVPAIDHKLVHLLKKVIKRGDDFLAFTLTTVEKNIYFKNIFENTIAKNFPEELIQYVFNAKGMATSCVVLENIILSVTNFAAIPYTDTENEILKRFAKVFEQSYTRFLDLKKAEAQAKEARIELALERVRARAMAMYNSTELAELVSTVFNELTQLDFRLTSCIIWIHDHENTKNTLWIASAEMNKPAEPFLVNAFHNDFFKSINHAWKSKDTKWIYTFTGKEKKNFEKAFFKELPHLPVPLKNALEVPKHVVFSASFNNFGGLEIVETEALTDEKFEILHRFGKVFDLSYTRFNDLKKAEAQAREAQIETGLERVRSKTMAMHKSEEVTGIAVSLNEELLKLGFEGGSTIIIIDKETGDTEQWTGFSEDKTLQSCNVPYFKHPYHDALLNTWIRGEKFLVYTLTGREKKTLDEHYFTTGYKDFPESDKKWMREMGSVTFSHAFMKYGAIHWGPNQLTEEQLKILQRFSKVFEQSYTRFLDLQKAESQAREAKIEAALERTRTQSMLMQHSDEIMNVSNIFHEQLLLLGIPTEFSYVWLPDETKQEHQFWATWAEEEGGTTAYKNKAITYPLDKTEPYTAACFTAWQNKEQVFIEYIAPAEVKNYFSTFEELLRDAKKMRPEFFTEGLYYAEAYMKYGCFGFNIRRLLSEDEQEILRRFTVEFERTYTRFLDLQKAEAQTREAQIETALERVRSRSMAMHKSDDLHEVIKVVTEQLSVLGLKFNVANFAKINSDGSWDLWLSTPEQTYPALIHVPYLDHPIFNRITEEEEKGNDFYTDVYTREATNIFFHHFFENTIAKNSPEERKQFVYSSKGLARSVFQTKNIWFSVARYDITAFTNEENAIFKRFANVFEQAYTRFLDLQKAEAQVREAQIEASLERVRSRAMAMQNSDELKELIGTVFTELTKLDIVLTRCLIMIYDPRSNDSVWWMANSEAPTEPIGLRIQNHEHPPYAAYLKAWQEKKLNWVYVLEGTVKKDWDDFLFVETELSHLPDFVIAGMKAPERVYLNSSFNSFGNLTLASLEPLSNEHFDILLRFAKVFDLTYTRFNDLKQAEAQARESQIELALERVRARTMAMQKSDELAEAAQLLYNEFGTLGINTILCGYMFINEEKNTQTAWTVLPDGTLLPNSMDFPLTGDHVLNKRYEDWKRKKPLHILAIQGETNKDHHRFLSDYVPSFVVENVFSRLPDRIVFHCANFSNGYLLILAADDFSADDQQTIIRFAKVFEMTYRRFLDLKQAEAQTREAQIELALERVRARTMAMHKSEELAETAQVLFQQLSELGGFPDRISIGIADEPNGVINFWTTDQQGSHLNHSFSARLNERTTIAKIYRAWKEQKRSLVVDLHGEELKEWIQFAREEMGIAVKDDQIKDRRVHTLAFFSHGWILVSSHEPQLPDTIQILERFASVFNLTYRRFLDLEKAESQAREAKIETVLERVRSRTMAMQKSDELTDVAGLLFEQVSDLGIKTWTAGFNVWSEDNNSYVDYITSPQGGFIEPYTVYTETAEALTDISNARKSGVEFDVQYVEGEKIKQLYLALTKLDEKQYEIMLQDGVRFPSHQYEHFVFGSKVSLMFITYEPVPEAHDIFKRLGKVFEQTYTRFLDLQKAEAQARESQIEASLERVRSKTMAMHNSQDVGNTVATMFDQLVHLGVTTNRCGILIFSNTNNTEVWTAKSSQSGEAALIIGHLDVTIHPMLQGVHHAWTNKETFHSYELAGDDIKNYYNVINNYPDYPTRFNLDNLPSKEIHSDFFFPEGAVFSFTSEPVPEEDALIFKRFAGVFGQTYRRYLDLQKAESQAREAQIEASLERVRSKTMAMHSSDDVTSATATMFTELERLGIENMRCGIAHYLEDHKMEVWSVSNVADGKVVRGAGLLDTNSIPFWKLFYSTWQKKEDFLYYYMAGKEKEEYFKKINAVQNYLSQSIEELPDLSIQTYYFPEGSVWAFSLKPHTEDDKQVMKRFASVFSLTFRRYQDLRKAEAQAKEATIEAALERVRGKAMAMHSSKDLATTIGVFYHELESLDLTPRRCGIGLINKETKRAEISTMNASADGEGIEMVGNLDLRSHPVLTGVYNNWLTKTEYHPVLRGNEIKEYYQIVRPQIDFPDYPNDTVQYGYFFFFDEGGVYAWTEKELSEEELKIYRRFTSVLSLTYKRYKDLKDAETRAKTAIKEAALDRIRADIASMRTINDLDRITPLIWNELTVLGVPFIRCGVFIMDEEQELIHTFLSTPDGKAIAAFHLSYDTPGNLSHVIANWKINRNYIDHWDESEFKQFAEILVEQGTLASAEQYLKTIPHGGFYLHFLPFLQGMLYVGNTTQLEKEEIELIQHVADAFSTAYARYEDFNKLEAAKQQVDKTLTDLKQAQTQLVQSEKMASLGELTAGIAHEIQNPLNFVNNFSDVSSELLEEMKVELEKGNKEDAIAIVEDVKQNLEKILHHGKRADAIVKGMLQHSRASSGQKEPTDVNVLADEYLRLAFHGLRAKDKSFNAKFETEFDNSIEKINIIPQDIGRVILNLINNAFYAVTEKKKVNSNGYEPVVTVTTKKESGKIEIKVRDNGNGIPQKLLDKIFQPFFTTKPTGQGTGLGLSLAYDIVTKGHGGELKVETREGEGSEFIIQLPASKATES